MVDLTHFGDCMLEVNLPDAELDAQYNNRALVPDFQNHLDEWSFKSALARQEKCFLDIPYGNRQGEMLDLFPARGEQKHALAPVMVFIHGGYWRSLDKRDHSFVAPPFTAQGVCVVVVNHDLCPQVSMSEIALQMHKAVTWVHEHIERYGGDPRRVTVVGHSAGGHLAALLLCTVECRAADEQGHDWLRSAVSISGLHDLAPIARTPFLRASLGLTDEEVQSLSPCRLIPQPGRRLLPVVGGAESPEFHRQALLIHHSWGATVVDAPMLLKGHNHFSVLKDLASVGGVLYNTLTGVLLTDPPGVCKQDL
jgi:arylformamidase